MLMKTVVMPVNPNSLRLSRDILNAGGVVAFPTETVYGLGADALNARAVESIFKIKNRPQDNPLIVHVHKNYDISTLVYDDKDYVKKLREKFTPGPLTLVYKSRGVVCPQVSRNLSTLAVRVPSHPDAEKLLEYVNIPLAAPSANISKHVSPVTAEHVLNDLDGKIPMVLDGGKCCTGIESTVLDVTGDIPVILRAGAVTKGMIEEVCGKCEVSKGASGEVRSPGMMYSHYKPTAETLFFSKDKTDDAKEVYNICKNNNQSVCIICDDALISNFQGLEAYNLGKTAAEISNNLYSALRDAEKKYSLIIGLELTGKGDDFDGVKNRFYKAFSVLNND